VIEGFTAYVNSHCFFPLMALSRVENASLESKA
jgi:hypothetical protein